MVTEDAGNAMLGSLLTITTANTDGGGDPEQSAAVMVSWQVSLPRGLARLQWVAAIRNRFNC